MTRRAVRVLLFLVLAATVVGAAAFIHREEIGAAPWRDAARQFDLETWRAQSALADLRTGQLALAAPGQGDRWWRNALVTLQQNASTSLDALRRAGSDPAALEQLGLAASALESVAQTGARAAELTDRDQPAQAAELVLADGLAAAATASRQIELARQAEAQAFERQLAGLRRRQAYAAGTAALVSLLIALLLLPRAAAPHGVSVDALPAAASMTNTVEASSATATAPPEIAAATPFPAPAPPPLADPVPAPDAVEAWPARDRRKAPELRAAADLCTDFARLLDGQELPALLERASRLLDATGLIVWIADPSQRELRPLLAHGYTAQALARLPSIPRDADNATAAAFRESQIEVVKTNGMSPGAVAVPMLSAQGCIGVMAAEVRHGREASESARALARIVAAQLATLVAIVPASEAAPPVQQAAR